ncbi:MAG: primosomal protein N' [Candidatus Nanopelagicales bacterium]
MTEPEQLALVASTVRKARVRAAPGPAEVDPVARVCVDVALPHLDRPFDYLVPEPLAAAAVPGTRVRVRFSGALVDGWVLERVAESGHTGRIERIAKVVSPDPVLAPEIAGLARAVADRWAGSLADVLRAAVPPRHAATEAALDQAGDPTPVLVPPLPPDDAGPWSAYAGGAALVRRIADPGVVMTGEAPGPRAVWTALPATDPVEAVAHLVAAAAGAGRGVLVVAPDAREVARLEAALADRLGAEAFRALSADLGPSARYRAYLEIRRGHVKVVVGTRAAVFAPVVDLGLIVLWDDGDDSLAEPHAPYWHAREVLALRAARTGAALVLGSTSRSVEAQALVEQGWAREVVAPRSEVRRHAPRIVTVGDADLARDEAARSARLPHIAWETARQALARGPVLVQVPRRGYVPALACQTCRELARCRHCHGPLGVSSGHAVPVCGWCGRLAGDWSCAACGGTRLRAVSVGERRTAEELGRAFPGVPVRTSGRDPSGAGVLDQVDGRPALVVATPGAEPRAEGGYAAALLLDGRVALDRPDLRAAEEAVRRWTAAVSLVRPASEGGAVVLVADPSLVPVQAVVRSDPGGFAARELAEREQLHLPPAWRVAEAVGAPSDVDDLLGHLRLPDGAQILGPVPVAPARRAGRADAGEPRVRALLVAPRTEGGGAALAEALKAAAGIRSARKEGGPVAVRVDPVALG